MIGIVALSLLSLLGGSQALNNGLARTPQMGWNSWNKFNCDINEDLIKQTAQALVDTGLAKYGYTYVNLDDCWAKTRDAAGRVSPDPAAFPSGMFKLGEFIHSLGLKYGIYSDAGNKTCAGRPGSLGYEEIDALTYAAWGIDYLKYDNCFDNGEHPEVRYPPMRDALNATGRPILFSMCEWGVDDPAKWAPEIGNSWRTTPDIRDAWDSMTSNLDQNDASWNYTGPGAWNDPDMLEVGNGNMTNDEYQAHFSLWALIKSPLLIGCDITNMSDATATILMNREVIDLSQDPLGVQGHKVAVNGKLEVWAGPLHNGDIGVILFNRDTTDAKITVDFVKDLGLNQGTTVQIRDLVAHKSLGKFTDSYTGAVGTHASQTLRFQIQKHSTISKVYAAHPRMREILHPQSLPVVDYDYDMNQFE
jgi:alpha-galactosidase